MCAREQRTHTQNHIAQVLLLPLFPHTSLLSEHFIWNGDVDDDY